MFKIMFEIEPLHKPLGLRRPSKAGKREPEKGSQTYLHPQKEDGLKGAPLKPRPLKRRSLSDWGLGLKGAPLRARSL